MNNINNYEMATPINAIKNNLVKNVESNIETLQNTNIQPINLTYNPNIEDDNKSHSNKEMFQNKDIFQNKDTFQNREQFTQQSILSRNLPNIKQNNYQQEYSGQINRQLPIKENMQNNEPSFFKKILVNLKEYLIITLLFTLFAHKKVNRLFFNVVPGLNTINTPIPSLLLRGSLLAFILFAIKKLRA